MMFEYRLHGFDPRPMLQMTIDDFTITLPRSASLQRAVDAVMAILDTAIAECEMPGPGGGNLPD